MSTIRDVAARAGVSIATVSRVLNGHSTRPEHARAVQKAARELDFRPNQSARNFRRQTSAIISLLVPDIENPFFTSIASGAEEVIRTSGFSLTLSNTSGDPALEEVLLDLAQRDRVAGVLLATSAPRTARGAAWGLPLVAVDRDTAYAVDRVVLANREIAARMTQRLIDVGHRRIACVCWARTDSVATDRIQGWRDAMASASLPAGDDGLVLAGGTADTTQAAVAEFLASERPDALLAASNIAAVGALRALDAAGLGPQDVAVGVIGELPFAVRPEPGVYTVRLPAREVGALAAERLVARVRGDDRIPQRIVLDELGDPPEVALIPELALDEAASPGAT